MPRNGFQVSAWSSSIEVPPTPPGSSAGRLDHGNHAKRLRNPGAAVFSLFSEFRGHVIKPTAQLAGSRVPWTGST
ncbi:hypothetical protein [Saccharopolyspora phatthalungensis]|uniref:Uncharacterized protein n=1 Tax=Saccharopolyspora phatthalungensis TaxID=664693 RepID=A0A840QCH6_9PSEU|nr:hypothetical protein [Saccharopolyspora phatthalungensis]MBB5157667.1 hypothetical protein [Saccharopolyspora phatthalungensis]